MKKISFKSLLFLPFVALIAMAFLGIGSKAFADDAYYTGNYTPAGCNANTMVVTYLTGPSDIPTALVTNTIYVLNSGDYSVT
jgi:hypothetical protein